MSAPSPPHLSRLLLEWASRRLRTLDLAQDAAELFAERLARESVRAARSWYRRQARAALWRMFLLRRPRRLTFRPITLAGLPLDAKLALRMLVRYPGLTAVAVVAIAFAIFVGAGLFEFIDQTFPGRKLPLPHGERIVGLRYWDRAAHAVEPAGADDLRRWRDDLRSIELIGGFRTVTRNLITGQGDGGGPVEAAVMSPVGFRLAGTAPTLGRVLDESDTAPDAAPVVVLGYRVWESRFGRDPSVIGRMVRLDDRQATVVGVMPEGFRFPISHSLWLPLPPDDAPGVAEARPAGDRRALDKILVRSRADGRTITVFGRLASGVSLDTAQAELDAHLARAVARDPERFAHVTGQVLPYREALFSRPITLMLRVIIMQLNAFAMLFLMLVSANIALLLFARTATRERELLLRTALGASRSRIVSQLFVEALALSVVATAAGLAAVGPGLVWLEHQMVAMGGGTTPFWFRTSVSPATAIYAGALAVLAAVVAGVVPALKATRHVGQSRLGQVPGGGGGLRFGGIWTAVVVTQIAATVVFTGGALLMLQQARRSGSVDTIFPASEYLTLGVEADDADNPARYRERLRALEEHLASQPGVSGVTLAERLPLMAHPTRSVVVDGEDLAPGADRAGHRVSVAVVDIDFFDVFRTAIVAGRGFNPADRIPNADGVIVDELFVQQVLGGRHAVGRQMRELGRDRSAPPGPWRTIVGVVRSLETYRAASLQLEEPPRPFVYRPLGPDSTSLRMAVHAPGGPSALASTVHRIAAAISPSLRVQEVQPLDEIASTEVAFWRLWAELIALVSGVALLLSLAGIYAGMSFAVSRRTREIGIRVALGARPARVVREILRRPALHVLAGVITGSVVLSGLAWTVAEGAAIADVFWLIALGALVLGICALACIAPARRALRVEPTQALAATE